MPCTLYLDPPRQRLYACLTCTKPNALCTACAASCHTDHALVELEAKRGFRCDCGTRTAEPCRLRRTDDAPEANPRRHYGQNFEGRFCVCSEHFEDPHYGQSTMFQCLLGTRCGEDWFHSRCVAGVSLEEEIKLTEQKAQENGEHEKDDQKDDQTGQDTETSTEQEDEQADEPADVSSIASTTPTFGIPSFAALICPSCAVDVPALTRSEAVLTTINGYVLLRHDFGAFVEKQLPKLLYEFPFLNDKEETYEEEEEEEEEDEDEEMEIEDQATLLDGLDRLGAFKTQLMQFLSERKHQGDEVTEEDIQEFLQYAQEKNS